MNTIKSILLLSIIALWAITAEAQYNTKYFISADHNLSKLNDELTNGYTVRLSMAYGDRARLKYGLVLDVLNPDFMNNAAKDTAFIAGVFGEIVLKGGRFQPKIGADIGLVGASAYGGFSFFLIDRLAIASRFRYYFGPTYQGYVWNNGIEIYLGW